MVEKIKNLKNALIAETSSSCTVLKWSEKIWDVLIFELEQLESQRERVLKEFFRLRSCWWRPFKKKKLKILEDKINCLEEKIVYKRHLLKMNSLRMIYETSED